MTLLFGSICRCATCATNLQATEPFQPYADPAFVPWHCMAPGTKLPNYLCASSITSILLFFDTPKKDRYHGRTSVCSRSHIANYGNSWPCHVRTGSQEAYHRRDLCWHFGCNNPYDTPVACVLLVADSVLFIWYCCHEGLYPEALKLPETRQRSSTVLCYIYTPTATPFSD